MLTFQTKQKDPKSYVLYDASYRGAAPTFYRAEGQNLVAFGDDIGKAEFTHCTWTENTHFNARGVPRAVTVNMNVDTAKVEWSTVQDFDENNPSYKFVLNIWSETHVGQEVYFSVTVGDTSFYKAIVLSDDPETLEELDIFSVVQTAQPITVRVSLAYEDKVLAPYATVIMGFMWGMYDPELFTLRNTPDQLMMSQTSSALKSFAHVPSDAQRFPTPDGIPFATRTGSLLYFYEGNIDAKWTSVANRLSGALGDSEALTRKDYVLVTPVYVRRAGDVPGAPTANILGDIALVREGDVIENIDNFSTFNKEDVATGFRVWGDFSGLEERDFLKLHPVVAYPVHGDFNTQLEFTTEVREGGVEICLGMSHSAEVIQPLGWTPEQQNLNRCPLRIEYQKNYETAQYEARFWMNEDPWGGDTFTLEATRFFTDTEAHRVQFRISIVQAVPGMPGSIKVEYNEGSGWLTAVSSFSVLTGMSSWYVINLPIVGRKPPAAQADLIFESFHISGVLNSQYASIEGIFPFFSKEEEVEYVLRIPRRQVESHGTLRGNVYVDGHTRPFSLSMSVIEASEFEERIYSELWRTIPDRAFAKDPNLLSFMKIFDGLDGQIQNLFGKVKDLQDPLTMPSEAIPYAFRDAALPLPLSVLEDDDTIDLETKRRMLLFANDLHNFRFSLDGVIFLLSFAINVPVVVRDYSGGLFFMFSSQDLGFPSVEMIERGTRAIETTPGNWEIFPVEDDKCTYLFSESTPAIVFEFQGALTDTQFELAQALINWCTIFGTEVTILTAEGYGRGEYGAGEYGD